MRKVLTFVLVVALLPFAMIGAGTQPAYAAEPSPITVPGAIESPGTLDKGDSIVGTVGIEYKGGLTVPSVLKPLDKPVRVYAQFYDRRNTAWSPVYTTVADASGQWGIYMRPFLAPNGKISKFDADPNLPEGEKFRVWSDNPDTSKYVKVWSWGNEGVWPPTNTYRVQAGANFGVGPNTIYPVRIYYGEKPKYSKLYHKDNADKDTSALQFSKAGNGTINGQVFWDYHSQPITAWGQALNFSQGNGDIPAPGLVVTGTYLTDDAVSRIFNEYKAPTGHKVRGGSWTVEDEDALQAWIRQQIEKDGKDKWFQETVKAETQINGGYALQFNGVWGDAWSRCWLVSSKYCHKPVGSAEEGSWVAGNTSSKHINNDWVYVSVGTKDGKELEDINVASRFFHNDYNGFGQGNAWSIGTERGWEVTAPFNSISYLDFALRPQNLNFDVLKYDTLLNPAAPGDKVETKTTGLPFNEYGEVKYGIEWKDTEGKKVGSCDPVKPQADGTIPSCPFTVPQDLAKQTTYTAYLRAYDSDGKTAEQELRQDAFTAIVQDTASMRWGIVDQAYPSANIVDPKNSVTGIPDTAIKDATETAKKEGYELKWTYKLHAGVTLPEGLTFNENTGQIEGTPKKPGTFEFGVDAIGTASKGDEELAGKVTRSFKSQFSVVRTSADKTTLQVGAKDAVANIKVDGPVKSAVISDFKLGDKAPEGFALDKDGKLTLTDKAKPGKDIAVPVEYTVTETVLAPNGKDQITQTHTVKDTVKITVVNKDSDGDGVPDPVDPNKPEPGEDKCPDTPKGETVDDDGCSLAQLYEPAYADSKVVAGKSVTVNPTFTKKDEKDPVAAPAGTIFTLGDGAPSWVTIDKNTGAVTFAPGVDHAGGDTTVPVVVTYPAKGGVDKVTAKVTVIKDSDGDGVPDPVDPKNPQPGEDKCPDTPKGDKVDENGCSLAQLYEPAYPDTTVEAGFTAKVSPTFTKQGETGNVEMPNGTSFEFGKTGVPAWAEKIDAQTGEISLAPGTEVPAGVTEIPVTVTYPDKGGVDKVTAKVTVTVTDSDNDGVNDGKDKCEGTPQGAQVDKDGCALAPTMPKAPAITGVVGQELSPVVVPVDNPGKATDLKCEATGLAEGLSIKYDEAQKGCVISGTPAAKIDGDYTVTLTSKRPDAGKEDNREVTVSAKITVTDPAPKDADNDGVTDDKDNCPDTPAGAEVDKNGCAVAPSIPNVPDVKGVVGTKITDVEVPVNNPGKATDLSCEAKGLADGLTITYDTAKGACVISGTPTAPIDGKFTVTVKGKRPDGNKGDVSASGEGTITVTKPAPGDKDKDGVTDDKDKCEGTPEGATVDEKGCAVAPSIPNAPTIKGEVGTAITPVVIPVNNPGKATDLKCTVTGLARGLTIAYDATKGACVISGTPEIVVDGTYTVTVEGKRPDGDKGKVTASKDGAITVTKPAPGDKDKDGVTDDKDNCPDTPAGAEVDKNGCAVAPSIPNPPAINGVVGTQITPVVIPVNNPGKATDLKCTVTGLANGLSGAYVDGKGCVISGTPTAPIDGNYTVTVTGKRPDGKKDDVTTSKTSTIKVTEPKPGDADNDGVTDDKDKCPGTPEGETVDENGCSLAQLYEPAYADTTVEAGKSATVTPTFTKQGETGAVKAPAGVSFALADGAPTWATIDATTGVITVAPGVDQSAGDVFVPVVVTYPNNGGKDNATAKITVTKPAPKDADNDGVTDDKDKCPGTPEGAKVDENGCAVVPSVPKVPSIKGEVGKELTPVVVPIDNPGKVTDLTCRAEGLADGLSIEFVEGKGCVISGTPTAPIDGDYTVIVDGKRPDGDKGGVTTSNTGKITIADKPAANPNWDDTTGKPGDKIVIENNGGPVPDGSTITTDGPGKAELDKNGNVIVSIDKNAKPGQKVVVTVKDKDGKVLDTVTVTVAKTAAPAVPGKGKLSKTGAAVGGVVLAAALLAGAGVFLVARRRRRS